MRVRAGFVSNSSSTSFLIIARDELDEDAFLDLMGVAPDSPIADLFARLFSDVIDASTRVDLAEVDPAESPDTWFDGERLSDIMVERLRSAAGRAFTAYYGNLDSETNLVQTFFCTDAFEIENERIYFNCLECVW